MAIEEEPANLQVPGAGTTTEGLREAFSQACQMYRHFVNMRYYTFAICGVVTAALTTLYFQQLPGMKDPRSAGLWIKGCGVMVAVACGLFDWRLTDVMYHYEELSASFARALKVPEFKMPPQTAQWIWPMRIASVLIFVVAIVAWICFAELPPSNPTK